MPAPKASKSRGTRGQGGGGFDKTLGRYYATLPPLVPGAKGLAGPYKAWSRKKSEGGTQQEANAKREERRLARAKAVDEGVINAQGAILLEMRWDTLGEWGDYYLFQLVKPRVDRGELSPQTFQHYKFMWEGVIKPALGHLPLTATRRSVIERWYNQLPAHFKDSTRRSAKRTLGTILQAAVDRQEETGLLFNGATALKLGKKDPTPKPEKSDDVTRAIRAAAAGAHDQLILDLGWRLGLRRQEITGLQNRDWDLEGGWLSIRRRPQRVYGQGIKVRGGVKSRGEQAVEKKPINPAVWGPLLHQHRIRLLEYAARNANHWTGPRPDAPNAWLFPTMRGENNDPQQIYNHFKTWARAAGHGERSLHSLRHDFVNASYESGLDSRQVALLAGHANSAITESVYGHATTSYKQQISGGADRWLDGLDSPTSDAVASS